MPDDERLEAISEALARLIQRQKEFDLRMTRIEEAVGLHGTHPAMVETPPPLPPQPQPQVPQTVAQHFEQQPPPPPRVVEPPPPPRPPSIPRPTLEARIGLSWMNILGVVTLIFAAAFAFKYAVDNNYVGPSARVALGILAAMISLFFGDLMWRKGQRVFGQGITGLGLALLYLSFWASFGLYHLIPQTMAFVLMVTTTAAAVVFAMRYESQAIAIIGILAGYWVPGALSSGEPRPWVLLSYVFLLNLGCLALARLRRWKALEYIAAVLTILWFGGWLFDGSNATNHLVDSVFAIAFYIQFCCVQARPIWAIAQLLGPLAIINIWSTPEEFLLMSLVYVAGGLMVAEIRRWAECPAWTLTCYWGSYFVWTLAQHPNYDIELRFGMITVGFALFFFWIVWWAFLQKRPLRNTDLLVMAVNAAAYFGASYYLLNPTYHAYMGLFAAAVGAVNLLLARLVWKPGATDERESWPALLAVAVTLTFLTLAIPIQFAGFRITIAWALEGVALAWISARFHSFKMSIGATIVLVLALLRLFIVDGFYYASHKDIVLFANPRFLAFAVTAISFFLAAKFFEERAQKLFVYVAAHFITLVAFGLELVDWVQRTVAPADQFETGTVSISILMALYALILVTLGVAIRSPIDRILGLGLMAVVVVKLYLSDVWELGVLFRIVAFLGLGILLVAVSYLYSRFRPAIERLWRNDSST